MIVGGERVQAPREGQIVEAEVLQVLAFRHKGARELEEVAVCQEYDSEVVFSVSADACVEIEEESAE